MGLPDTNALLRLLLVQQQSGMQAPQQNALFNAQNASMVPYRNFLTQLPQSQEGAFQRWVTQTGAPFDPSPMADYDMRGFYQALMSGHAPGTGINPNDNQLHFTDQFKTPYHESFSAESQYATPDAPQWNPQDQLVDKYGRVVYDERAAIRNKTCVPYRQP
jgi:hypothetical protein